MSADSFSAHLRAFVHVVPTVSDGVGAMSSARMRQLLSGYDPLIVVEAASVVLATIEAGERDAQIAHLPRGDQRALDKWMREAAHSDHVANTFIHALSAVSASRIALSLSAPSSRDEASRNKLVSNLMQVALRLNGPVLDGVRDERSGPAMMTQAAYWKELSNFDWAVWAGEIVVEMCDDVDALDALADFEQSTGLTLSQWWSRSYLECRTRQVTGAAALGTFPKIDTTTDRAWFQIATVDIEDVVDDARMRMPDDPKHPTIDLAEPHDIGWLAQTPIVVAGDERRHLWSGALLRYVAPAQIAQSLADQTTHDYRATSALVGRAAERLLRRQIEGLLPRVGEDRTPEENLPNSGKRCDYLLTTEHTLVGVEFTISTPSARLTTGDDNAIDAHIERLASKVTQIYATFERVDPNRTRRWLPLLVLVAPTAVEPLLLERVHERLGEAGVLPEGSLSELMACYATDFHDLVQYCCDHDRSLVDVAINWRDGPQRGTALDFWLAERRARRQSGKQRHPVVAAFVENVLTVSN